MLLKMQSNTLEVDIAVCRDIVNILKCCINVKNNNRLLLLSLAVEGSIYIQFNGHICWKISKCSHHYIWFYFHQEHSKANLQSCHFHTGVSLLLALFFFISIYSLFPPFHSLFHFFSFSLTFLPSVFHVTPLAGVGELMASLSDVLAVVLLQLLGCDKERKEEKFSH